MAIFRSLENITLAMLDFIRIVQPDLDTKPGTLARDLMVDAPAQEIAKLYVELRNIANLQAITTATGLDLDRLSKNFGQVRSTGSKATGTVILTTSTLDSDILIPVNSLITAKNGFSFRTQVQASFLVANANVYKANANRLRTDLDLAGISDQYAVEIAVEATNPGLGGNIGKFGISGTNLPGVTNATNLQSFSGGSSTETDDVFRARVLNIFAGSNTGTALGYVNALLSDTRIVDLLTVEPGDPLMIRDGTQVSTNSSGEKIVLSSGTGGKVDIYIQGSSLDVFSESFIYRDKSGKNDPTQSVNDFVLGQRGISTLLDFQQRRRLSLQNGQLPYQPVDSITSVSGSLSGPNFIQKFTDASGQEQGSYELLTDDGVFGGSPFGFDKLHFISKNISLEDEVTTKGILNGQDALDFTDIQSIDDVIQNFVVNNETATVSSSDRSLITLDHLPIVSVERITNLTTGERYSIANSNPNGTAGDLNTSGVVKISGKTLPTTSDVLQANYLWQVDFDEHLDYDNLDTINDFRTVQDSIDWGFSNRVLAEEQTVLYSVTDGYHVLVTHPVSKVVNVNTRLQETIANSLGKLVVSETVINIANISDSDGKELFNTALDNGAFSGTEITLPTDTISENGELATVVYNVEDLFSPDGYDNGTFSDNIIRLPDGVASAGQTVFVDYVANINTLLDSTSLLALPITRSENTFVVNGNSTGDQLCSALYASDNVSRFLRFAPSYLFFDVQGIPSRGRLAINGTSFIRIDDVLTILDDSLTIDLELSIKNNLGISSIPSTALVSYVAKLERVKVEEDLVSEVEFEFDLLNYEISDSQYSNNKGFTNLSLSRTQFKLSATESNLDNIPTTGQRLRITYYYTDTNQTENINILNSGTRISKYKYLFVDSITIASGFTNTSNVVTGNITVKNFNQPISGNTYLVSYNYTAPKEGERITIQYNYNRLISDATFKIEKVRPITADVLIKAASSLEVDISLKIVALPTFKGSTTTLEENVKEAITIFATATGLNTTLDASDIINAAYTVSGVDRVTLTKFNTSGVDGIVKSISADRNEFITAGQIEVDIETR